MTPEIPSSVATDRGRRASNQDAWLDRPDLGVWAVADGAGGHDHGAFASRAVVDAIAALPADLAAADFLVRLRAQLDAVHARLSRDPDVVMASTVVALVVRGGHFACLWAGDSRAYKLRDGQLEQLTRDHSLVQDLVERGELAATEAEHSPQSHIITRAIGGSAVEAGIEKVLGDVAAGDRFLLCSDGVSKALDVATLAALLAGPLFDGIGGALVREALARGGTDNATALVVEFAGSCR